MDFSKLVDWIKLSPTYILAISLSSGILLFSNDRFLDTIGLAQIRNQFKTYIGLAFLISLSLLASHLIVTIYQYTHKKFINFENRHNRKNLLQNLTSQEKEILLPYILQDVSNQYLPMDDGVVGGLLAKGVIFQGAFIGEIDSWAFNIQPWAYQLLKEQRNLLFTEEQK
jgi:hypothetical protein